MFLDLDKIRKNPLYLLLDNMDYLIRLVQVHQTFRRPEIEALATLAGINVEIIHYDDNVGFTRRE